MSDKPKPPEPSATARAYRPASNPPELPVRDYDQLPWFRKSSWNSALILLSVLSCGLLPGTLLVCVLVLTGNIYYNKKDENGNLKKWDAANKVVAVILLGVNLLVLLSVLGNIAASSVIQTQVD